MSGYFPPLELVGGLCLDFLPFVGTWRSVSLGECPPLDPSLLSPPHVSSNYLGPLLCRSVVPRDRIDLSLMALPCCAFASLSPLSLCSEVLCSLCGFLFWSAIVLLTTLHLSLFFFHLRAEPDFFD